jgi:dihydrolipoamide dehydrogenase
MKTAVVEREHLGGICLNWGCIPTKALLRTAEIFDNFHHAESFGLKVEKVSFDLDKVVKRSRGVAGQLSKGVGHLLKKNKVTVLDGAGKLAGQGKLEVELNKGGKETLTAKHIILATGARARQLPGLEADGKLVWSYKEAMVPDMMPKSLLVVGSGAIGIEFASFFRSMGAEVTVVEVLDRVLPVEDADISAFARKQFEKRGIKCLTSAQVKGLKKGKDNVTATIEAGGKSQELTVDRVIMAVGIVGNVEKLGLEGTKVKVDRAHIVVDEWCRTGEPGVYAIGDVVGAPWLAHKASHEGVMCVERIAGIEGLHPMDVTKIPGCTYCNPQVASVGLSEAAAKEEGPQGQGRQVPVHRQRQGDCARRARGHGQDGLRRRDRRAARRPHDRCRSDRADPGLRHRAAGRGHRARPHAHRLSAPDALRDDARGRARRVWQGHPLLIGRAAGGCLAARMPYMLLGATSFAPAR